MCRVGGVGGVHPISTRPLRRHGPGTRPRCRSRLTACAAGHCTIERRCRLSKRSSCWPAQHAVSGGGPLQRGTATLALPARWRWGVQGGIQLQPGDDTDMVAHRGQKFECGEAAVGDKDEQTSGWSAFGLQDAPPRSVGQRLVPFPVGLHRADGARTVKSSSAQCSADQPIGTTTISDSQRGPLVFTKCLLENLTGSRERCHAP